MSGDGRRKPVTHRKNSGLGRPPQSSRSERQSGEINICKRRNEIVYYTVGDLEDAIKQKQNGLNAS